MSAANKAIICTFNLQVIERCDRAAFEALVAESFVNHTAAAGQPSDRESLWHTFRHVLHSGLTELRVEVLDQIAEHDKVTTRKRITGQHSGVLLGIPATGRAVSIDVMDIVRIEEGRYVEHWGINSLPTVLAALRLP
ncbi:MULTISPECIES: ester cyclase [unclassified Pseudomonas]|uniref:ester cyclase n=1 Tax=unclassified Pseudomonas TaxID=196821 RepID=UPI0025E05E8E|nr:MULTISPECIES: ester cyclase [unclassified Pseudomonas]